MSQYILDYKGFYLNRELIVKELAYYCLESDVTKVYHFKPEINFVDLSEKEQNVVRYYEKHVHGIPWNSGYFSPSDISRIVPTLSNDVVYVNSSKIKYVASFLANQCLVLDQQILTTQTKKSCINPELVFCISAFHSKSPYCALHNVLNICSSIRVRK